ncbi:MULTISPECIES: zinc metallopeptidase [Microbulbifer]|uniref:zinc metallopeptidase n=1 Tax=Microbulbifer TaxID=48073 RepID=UPI001E4362D3|nr:MULTISPECIES: zinc metallopeptidase [Microbulbifer]UHQ55250.1 zinc metallopeptidase [Microbulbifer sp. YPW16]
MIYGLGALLVILLVYGPSLWVQLVMWRHSKQREAMPGTGGELARHLVERFGLDGVTVERGRPNGDHYDPAKKIVSLSPRVHDGKSLTAVAVAAHEVGHAIQFTRNEPVSHLRQKHMGKAFFIRRLGTGLMLAISSLALVARVPHIFAVAVAIGVLTMMASALMYAAILPEEYDASFNKALPILEEGYVPAEHMPAVRSVLKAAALTYFAGALTEMLSLWRWLRFIR